METIETIKTGNHLTDKGKLFIKSMVIFAMALVLWLPTYFILDIVKERAGRQKEAIADISSKWANKQVVTGPILMVPYNEQDTDDKGNKTWHKRTAYFMPSKLDIESRIVPEKRHRGIYEVAVYRSELRLSGKFDSLQWQQLGVTADNILWDQATLVFKVEDHLKGINEDVFINWNGSTILFNPQSSGQSFLTDGFVAPAPFTQEETGKDHSFSMHFFLNGSEQLVFTPVARENKIQMRSAWPNPSFTGIRLPDTREVKDSGFVANWKFLNRTIPPVWKNTTYYLSSSVLGADLLIPVDSYDKTERSVKYALLCIILTFAAFFLIETIYKKPLHLLQYGLAGLALVLFYTLLLSISEYIGFNPAYLVSAIATIGLVVWYVGSVMRSSRIALFISFVLAVVYGYIFTIIQLQDYSLLMGSIGLFIALAVIMFFSRKLQWQND
ncbi:MAG: cell envelope integrity protein CreD [Chitinophagaceae bacterium]